MCSAILPSFSAKRMRRISWNFSQHFQYLEERITTKMGPILFFFLSVCEERGGSPCPRSGEEKNTENLQAFLGKYVTKIPAPMVYKRDFGVHIPGMFSKGVS